MVKRNPALLLAMGRLKGLFGGSGCGWSWKTTLVIKSGEGLITARAYSLGLKAVSAC
jgi:hypothetical protein